jgi:hypothetical protein
VSENSITRQQAGLVRRAKTSCPNPAMSLGSALVANSLCPGQEKRTMQEPEGKSEIPAQRLQDEVNRRTMPPARIPKW